MPPAKRRSLLSRSRRAPRARLAAMSVSVALSLAAPATADRVILIPDSLGDLVLAFSAHDGSVILDNTRPFIRSGGSGPTLVRPRHIIPVGTDTLLLSDQEGGAVYKYSTTGEYLGVFADISIDITDVRGMAVRDNHVYLCVGAGPLANTIQRLNIDGSGRTTWTNTAISGPYDILFRGADVLIANRDTDSIERYDLNGSHLGAFHDSDGINGIDFPQQLNLLHNQNIIAGGLNSPYAIFEYDNDGNEVNRFTTPFPVRGVVQLDNGNLLYSDAANGLWTYNPVTRERIAIFDEAYGASFEFIEFADITIIPAPASPLALVAAGFLALARRSRPASGRAA